MGFHFIKLSSLYFDMFLTKFQENQSYYWPSTLGNARDIFYFRLESDLDFLNQEAIDIVLESESIHESKIVSNYISEKSKNEIPTKFKKHRISHWDLSTILFSCGVGCCVYELKSIQEPSPHFFLGYIIFY